MKSNQLITSALVFALAVGFSLTLPVYAGGAETLDDALAVIDVALESDDLDALESLIHEDLGLDIAGQEIPIEEFNDAIHDESKRELCFVTETGIETQRMSLEYFLWGEDGAFTVMREVTMAHFRAVEREELFSEATMALWEHGELETAAVINDSDTCFVYIFPDLNYRLTFVKLDGLWYLSAIAARE